MRAVAFGITWALSTTVVAQDTTPTDEAIAAALARYESEPTVEVVVAAALDHAGLADDRIERARRRGRRSGLLPTVRLGATRDRGTDRATTQGTANPAERWSADDGYRLEARLVFDLSTLTYGPDEIAWSREERAFAAAREALVRDVVALYFRRRRLQLERDVFGDTSVENTLARLEVEALLEAFTGGAFSRMIGGRASPR